jgi:hypothetical protein
MPSVADTTAAVASAITLSALQSRPIAPLNARTTESRIAATTGIVRLVERILERLDHIEIALDARQA